MARPKSSKDQSPPIYEQIGRGYAYSRRADPRWESRIHEALQGNQSVVNIGAGSGSYEPRTMDVVAVEPSEVMIRQRPKNSAPVVCATAEQLPFADASFDAALAVLTTHHWSNARGGLLEMRRVARSQVFVTWDPAVFAQEFWFIRDYLPEVGQRELQLATLNTVVDELGNADVSPLPIPADFMDGVLGAFWRRPEAYLSESIRGAMSGIALTDSNIVEKAINRLRNDLEDGAWQSRYKELLDLSELDIGYRLVKINS